MQRKTDEKMIWMSHHGLVQYASRLQKEISVLEDAHRALASVLDDAQVAQAAIMAEAQLVEHMATTHGLSESAAQHVEHCGRCAALNSVSAMLNAECARRSQN